jgi:hypothetical protein
MGIIAVMWTLPPGGDIKQKAQLAAKNSPN